MLEKDKRAGAPQPYEAECSGCTADEGKTTAGQDTD